MDGTLLQTDDDDSGMYKKNINGKKSKQNVLNSK